MKRILILAAVVVKEMMRRKDFYLIFALLLVIIFYAAGVSFGGQKGFERYFREIAISLAHIFSVLIAVVFAARQIPQETEARTIYPVLGHPVSRLEFILGKFAGVLLIASGAFTLFYGTVLAAFFLRGDLSGPPALLLEGYVLHLCLLSFFAALAILFSLYLSIAANVGITMIIYFGTNWFGATFPAYIFLPHPELFDIREKLIHTWDTVPAWALAFLVLYACIYTAIFVSLAYAGFKRRDL